MASQHFTPDDDQWEPPMELMELLTQKRLRQRDRVELVIAFYAADHGGNSPTYDKIGEVLSTSKGNAYKFAMELTQSNERRAVKRNGQFWLINSQYTHPVIKQQFAGVLRPS